MKRSEISVIMLIGFMLAGSFGISWASNNPFDEDTEIGKKKMKVSIAPLPTPELVGGADIIAIGVLKETKTTKKKAQGFQVVENVFEITRVLKGSIGAGEKVTVSTLSGLEDEAKPVKKEKALLFLVKNPETNQFSFNNGVQGCWPIDSKGRLIGMGTGESLAQIKNLIQQKPPAPNKMAIPVPEF